MKLRFIGTDGSMQLKKNETYGAYVKSDKEYIWVHIEEKNFHCPYLSPQAFAENWEASDDIPHGYWKITAEMNNGEKVYATCSHCKTNGLVRTKRSEWGIWHIDSPYCPNCGARMDGK